jgi:hypothetical protein
MKTCPLKRQNRADREGDASMKSHMGARKAALTPFLIGLDCPFLAIYKRLGVYLVT